MILRRSHALLSKRIDPFRRLLHSPTPQLSSPQSPLSSSDGVSRRVGDTGKHSRESSIRSNRRLKFIDCLNKEDLNICKWLVPMLDVPSDDIRLADLRKLAWSGTPGDLRPVVWPILLVRCTCFLSITQLRCSPRDIYLYLQTCAQPRSLANEESISRWLSSPLLETAKASISRSGTRLR